MVRPSIQLSRKQEQEHPQMFTGNRKIKQQKIKAREVNQTKE